MSKIYLWIFLSLNALAIGGQRKLFAPKLASQNNTPVNWSDYTYVVVGTKDSKLAGEVWGDHISQAAGISRMNICAIASIPSWMTLSPGSKYVIRNSIRLFENKIPVFIDWDERFSKSNHISDYPTVLLIRSVGDSGDLLEVSRVSGNYEAYKWNELHAK